MAVLNDVPGEALAAVVDSPDDAEVVVAPDVLLLTVELPEELQAASVSNAAPIVAPTNVARRRGVPRALMQVPFASGALLCSTYGAMRWIAYPPPGVRSRRRRLL